MSADKKQRLRELLIVAAVVAVVAVDHVPDSLRVVLTLVAGVLTIAALGVSFLPGTKIGGYLALYAHCLRRLHRPSRLSWSGRVGAVVCYECERAFWRRDPEVSVSRCPADDVLGEFVEGGGSPELRRLVLIHVSKCEVCREAAFAAAAALEEGP